jgi:hypothetical protein
MYEIPVYLESSLESFYSERARKRKIDIGTLINTVLRKEMEGGRKTGTILAFPVSPRFVLLAGSRARARDGWSSSSWSKPVR